ncbi:MAG: PAS domain S-box protein [Mariprofundaceae bacterium]|nr:PAS domain S-box protein [Mariprofundaceae bacterium]
MNERRRILMLILIMTVTAMLVGGIAVFMLYRTALEQTRAHLIETVDSQAQLLLAVARFDAVYSQDYPGGTTEAALTQFREAHKQYIGFGESGEFTLAKRDGDFIVFLLEHRHDDVMAPETFPFDSTLAEPMRRALNGYMGTIIGLDYRGATVVAAYHPLTELGMGIVAKIDLAEVQAPFIQAGVIAGLSGLLIILISVFIFQRVSNPMLTTLVESEQRFSSISERLALATGAAKIGVWDWDIESNTLLWDDQMYQLYGVNPQDFSGAYEAWSSGLHPEDKARSDTEVQAALNGERDFDTVFRVVHPDGQVKTIKGYGVVERNASGQPVRMVGVNWDISEQVQKEQQIRASQARLQAVLDSAVDGIITIDESGLIQSTNLACEKLFGFAADEMAGQNINMLMPEPYHSGHDGYLSAYVQTGVKKVIGIGREVEGQHKNGAIFPLELSVSEFWVDEQRMFTGIVRDISARKRADVNLARMAAIVDSADSAIISKNLEGGIQSWNLAAERLYGYRADEVIGQNITIIVPPEKQSELATLHNRIQRGEHIDHFETERICKDGQRIPVALTLSPIHDAHGQIIGISAVEIDLTRRIEREQELQQAKTEAEAANQAKSEFLASMSHELRTPLNAIIGFSELLEQHTFGELNAKQNRYVQNILTSGKHLLNLINDILDIAKVEAGRLDLTLEKVDIAEIIHGVVAIVGPLTAKKNITLKSTLPPDLPVLNADAAKIKQILYNLLSNAIKFTPEHGQVFVQCAVDVEGQDSGIRGQDSGIRNQDSGISDQLRNTDSALLITVRDTGIGLKPEDLERVFGEFEQVDSSYARQQQGTGLGLALTRKLAALHGGQVWAQSDGPGQGSTFSLRLPLDGPVKAAPEEAAIPVRTPGQPLVLIVEDDSLADKLLSQYLTEAGYALLHASDRQTGLRLAQEHLPDVITLDILLPEAENG